MVATFLFAISWQAQASSDFDLFLQPCADDTVLTSGQFRAFNEAQCRLAKAPVRTQAVQEGNTCVCEALLNVAYELDEQKNLHELRTKYPCKQAIFSAVFADYAKTSSTLAGRVFGGVFGAMNSKSLTSTDEAMHQIAQAVSDGRIVAVGLNAKPIYDFYAQRLGVSYSGLGVTGGHALVVRAVIKNSGYVQNEVGILSLRQNK